MDIEFEGQYEKQQYFKAIYLAGKPSQRSTIWRIIIFVAFTGLLIVMVIMTMQDGNPSGYEVSRILRYLFAAFLLAYFIFRPYVNIYTTANRLWKDPLVRRKITGSVSNRGISYGIYDQEWGSFLTRRETEEMVVLLTADRAMSLLPRNFFKSDKDWKRFRQLVEYKVVEAK